MSEFEDKVVIVTGAGGSIDRKHALEFGRRGARVVVNDLGSNVRGEGDSAIADEVVAQIKLAGGVAVANYNSVSDPDQAQAIVDQAEGPPLGSSVGHPHLLRSQQYTPGSKPETVWDCCFHRSGTNTTALKTRLGTSSKNLNVP